MYATERARPQSVHVYDISTWRRLREIPIPCCSAEDNSIHTLQVTDDRILLCCYDKNKLHVLSHSGELLQTHGRSRSEATEDDIIGQTASGKQVYSPGVLHGPLLCQVDVEGSAIVADCYNDRLQVMRADGTWSIVDLRVEQDVGRIKGALWCNGSLYVARNRTIVRYSGL